MSDPKGVELTFPASTLAVAMNKLRPDLTYTKIAEILGVNVTTVSRAIRRYQEREKNARS